LWEVFSEFFEEWMDESDKSDFIMALCEKTETTLDALNDQIVQGVKNGHSVGKQIALCKSALRLFLG